MLIGAFSYKELLVAFWSIVQKIPYVNVKSKSTEIVIWFYMNGQSIKLNFLPVSLPLPNLQLLSIFPINDWELFCTPLYQFFEKQKNKKKNKKKQVLPLVKLFENSAKTTTIKHRSFILPAIESLELLFTTAVMQNICSLYKQTTSEKIAGISYMPKLQRKRCRDDRNYIKCLLFTQMDKSNLFTLK